MTSRIAWPEGALYRIDLFDIPDAARGAFAERAAATQAVLRRQAGLVGEKGFERVGGPGRFNIATLAAWENAAALEAAAKAVAEMHAATGFDRQTFVAQHGIAAEIATFRAFAL